YMRNASVIYREVPFSLTLSAKEVYPAWENETDESVLVQGVIDCVVPGENGWIILDYKTDAVHEELTATLKRKLSDRYQTQIDLYKYAIETIWKEPVEEAYLYYFHKQLLLKM
ncbi:MAG TPA: PD-(D/E)XK nuclease family protein, partial [Bacillota bacterium]|nr:PD-(D/E)XK nuclease family protein [Bacillota bacterium]